MLSSFFASDKHEIGVKRTNNTHYDGEQRGDLLRFDRNAQKTIVFFIKTDRIYGSISQKNPIALAK